MDQESQNYVLERLTRVEREQDRQRLQIDGLVTKTAILDTVMTQINETLKDIKTEIRSFRTLFNRAAFVAVSTIIVAVVTWMLKGGLMS